MAGGSYVEIKGLKKLQRLLRESDEALDMWLREGLLDIADHVAVDVRMKYSEYSETGAKAIRPKVMRSGRVLVAQTMRKSRSMTRRRRDFGGLMMVRAFLPAIDDNKKYIEESALALVEELRVKWKEEGL